MHFPIVSVSAIAMAFAASQNAFAIEDAVADRAMTAFAIAQFESWIDGPEVVNAIRAQNQSSKDLSPDDILTLDAEWRSQFNAANQPMIDEVMNNSLSRFLVRQVTQARGKVTEVIVVDAQGLNVGQSALTTDFWQGDEEKYSETYLIGPEALHVSEVEKGESNTIYQKQVSMSITDPNTQTVIGAVTISVNTWYFY